MGERAHRAYEEAEREAFRRLSWRERWTANAVALCVVGGLLAVMLFYVLWPIAA